MLLIEEALPPPQGIGYTGHRCLGRQTSLCFPPHTVYPCPVFPKSLSLDSRVPWEVVRKLGNQLSVGGHHASLWERGSMTQSEALWN